MSVLNEFTTAFPVEDLTIPADILKKCRFRVRRTKLGTAVSIELPSANLLPRKFVDQITMLENQMTENPKLMPDPRCPDDSE
jgi:hypothetical protein